MNRANNSKLLKKGMECQEIHKKRSNCRPTT